MFGDHFWSGNLRTGIIPYCICNKEMKITFIRITLENKIAFAVLFLYYKTLGVVCWNGIRKRPCPFYFSGCVDCNQDQLIKLLIGGLHEQNLLPIGLLPNAFEGGRPVQN